MYEYQGVKMQRSCRWEMALWKIFAVKAEEYLGPNVVIKTVGLAHFWKANRVLLTRERASKSQECTVVHNPHPKSLWFHKSCGADTRWAGSWKTLIIVKRTQNCNTCCSLYGLTNPDLFLLSAEKSHRQSRQKYIHTLFDMFGDRCLARVRWILIFS